MKVIHESLNDFLLKMRKCWNLFAGVRGVFLDISKAFDANWNHRELKENY